LNLLLTDQFIAEIAGQREELKDLDVSKRQATKAPLFAGLFGIIKLVKCIQAI